MLAFGRTLIYVVEIEIEIAWETRAIVLWFSHCLRSPFLGSGMNVENEGDRGGASSF